MRIGRSIVAVLTALLLTAPLAGPALGARSSCSFDTSTGSVKVKQVADDRWIDISRERGGDAILVDGRGCHGATVRNVDRIRVYGGRGAQRLSVSLANGPLAPGRTEEDDGFSEIEITFMADSGDDQVSIVGSSRADRLEIGPSSAAFTADADVDVWWWEVEHVFAWGYEGADRIRIVSGGPKIGVGGGDGADLLIGSTRRDSLDGGPGRDSIFGAGGDDQIRGGVGTDEVRAGAGRDRVFLAYAFAEAVVDCGPGIDVIRDADPEDLAIATGCEAVPQARLVP